jgi:hypothetical protein
MLLGDELRAAIKAYEDARAQAKAVDPPEILEAWDAFPLKMRLAFISVFSAGRQLGAKERAKEICRPAMVAGDEARRCGREAVMMPKLCVRNAGRGLLCCG